MDVNEMKRQILEKLKEKKASGVPAPAVTVSGEGAAAGAQDLVRKLRGAMGPEPARNSEAADRVGKIEKELDGYRSKCDELARRIESKDAEIADLRKKAAAGVRFTDAMKASARQAGDADRLAKELAESRKQVEDYRLRLDAVQAEGKKISVSRADAVKQREAMAREIEARDGVIEELRKKLDAGAEALKKEQERSRGLSETARASEARAGEAGRLARELDEKSAQIRDLQKALETESSRRIEANTRADSLEGLVKSKEKKMADIDKLAKELGEAKRSADEYRAKLDAIVSEQKKAVVFRADSLKHAQRMRADLQKKNDIIADLQRRAAKWDDEARQEKERQKVEAEAFKAKLSQAAKDHAEKTEALEETVRAGQKRVAEAEKVHKELEAARREGAGYRTELELARADIEKLNRLNEEADSRHAKLREDLEGKQKALQGLEKQYRDELDDIRKEKEKAAANVEGLRSKLYTATKESREQAARILQAEETLKARDRKLAEAEKLSVELGIAKGELEARLKASKEEIDGLGEKIAGMNADLASKAASSAEMEKAFKASEAAKTEAAHELQARERDIKKLEARVTQLGLEIDAKNMRLEETERLHKEIEGLVGDVTDKYQESQRGRKELEAQAAQLAGQIDTLKQDAAEALRTHNRLEVANADLESKLKASREEAGELEAKIAAAGRDIEARDESISRLDASRKETEASLAGMASQFESARRDNKDLAVKISQLKLEIEAKDARLKEADGLQAETEGIVRDLNLKIQAMEGEKRELESRMAALERQSKTDLDMAREAEAAAGSRADKAEAEIASLKGALKEKERRELEMKNTIAGFGAEIQARDTKIESDMKYTEKVVKEVSELRRKLGAAERKD